MVLEFSSSSSRDLSVDDELKLANEQLENAREATTPAKKLQLCNEAKSKIGAAENIFLVKNAGQQTQDKGIATAYHEHARLLDDLEYHDKAQESHSKAKDWGYIDTTDQQTYPAQVESIRTLVPSSARPNPTAATNQEVLNLDIAQPDGQRSIQETIPGIKGYIPEMNAVATRHSRQLFSQDIHTPFTKCTLPEDTRHITSTPQLAYCLSMSLPSMVSKEGLDDLEYQWSQVNVTDPDEYERLQAMATDVIRAFVRDDLKKSDAVAEVVCLSSVIDQEDFRKLLQVFVDGIDQSILAKVHLLDGLAHLIRNAAPGYLDVDDLVKILELLNARLKGTHQQSTHRIYQLTQVVSHVLDSMVDSQVKGLKREQLHVPLSEYLKRLQESSDPSMVYQAAYAYQALQYIPDDETILQTMVRRTGKVVQGISGVVSAVKALDVNSFIDGLKGIQGGLDDIIGAMSLAKEAYSNVMEVAESGQNLLESLKEGFSFSRKSAWYPALRGLDTLIQQGQLAEFEKLIREAPCRRDVAFQWGVSQRLGEIASSALWDASTRQTATSLLGEMYKDDATWGQQVNIKKWILRILTQLSNSSGAVVAGHALKCLLDLEANGDSKKRSLFQDFSKETPIDYPLVATLTLQKSQLLDYVLNKPDVEAALCRLRFARLSERDKDVYISPRAKASLKATDDFDLTSKVQGFLNSEKKVLLLLGDSGAGKSTFNRALETSLWDKYGKVGGRIPLFVHLPTIEKPEFDLIAKQLRKADFTEQEIKELKQNREFILICDGYDESQETRNLYSSNQLNKAEGWKAQMIISCRTEYTGVDYKDCFQPTDGNRRGLPELLQEVIITPFNKDQINEYINQYVSSRKPIWESKDYQRALEEVPNLRDLVTNPFLLKLALEVLPRLVCMEGDLTSARITRIGLYDEFVSLWLERGKTRLTEMELSLRDTDAFMRLSQFGFNQEATIFLKEFSTAIYDNQSGNPVVSYSGFRDRSTWKEAFFDKNDGKNLLLGSMPLIVSGTQYRFIHRSMLEYGLTLAIFGPRSHEEIAEPTLVSSRRGSTSSVLSFEAPISDEKTVKAVEQPLMSSPLARKNFVSESSILLFLVERAQQQPIFKEQLHSVIQLSKTEKTARTAATNAITVLIKAGDQFNGADLRGIRIPGADLSYGVLDSAQLNGADLRKANLRNVWLRQADLSGAQMAGVQFGEMPFLPEVGNVDGCAYSLDGTTFVTGLSNGDISLYDTSDWSRIQTLRGHSKNVFALAYSQNGDWLVSGSRDGTVKLWDVKTGSCIHDLQGHSGEVKSVAFSPKGDCVVSGSDDTTVRLWDVESGNCVHTLQEHSEYVRSVVYSPNGSRIVSGGWDKSVRLWDTETGRCVHNLQGHTDKVMMVAHSPKGGQIASASADETVRLWDGETGSCTWILQGHTDYIMNIAYSPRGDRIASASDDRTVRLWNTETGDCIHTLQGHSGAVVSVTYSPEGDQIASGSYDETVRLWDIEAGNCIQTLNGHRNYVLGVLYSPKGGQVASRSMDNSVRLWHVKSGSYAHDVHNSQGQNNFIKSVACSPNGGKVVSGSDDKTVRLWDVKTGNCLSTLEGHSGPVWGVAYSPKGHQIASGSRDKTVRIWDVEGGACIRDLRGHEWEVTSVAYSPSGDMIASGSRDETVRLWDVETGGCINTLQGHTDHVRCVAYSPKGDQIVSGSDDKIAKLWDVETGRCIHTLEGHKHYVRSLAFSPKGDQVASGSSDSTIRLWDVKTGDHSHTLQGHTSDVLSVLYSPKGDQIVSGSYDNTMRLWNIETGQCLVTIQGFDGGVESIAWENALYEQHLITGSKDKSVRRWRIIEDQDGHKLTLCWSSSHSVLTVHGASFNDSQGLSPVDQMLLKQRGASISLSSPPK